MTYSRLYGMDNWSMRMTNLKGIKLPYNIMEENVLELDVVHDAQ